MFKAKENKVSTLISTLNKAEKRSFKLFAKSKQDNNPLFLRLFELYNKYGYISDEMIVKKIPQIKLTQLPNLRNHLYKQLLTSLRLHGIKNNIDIAIRQEIDFARMLYNKGLYRQALGLLSKAKDLANQNNQNVLRLEINFFEKIIESQNITKSIETRASDLVSESENIAKKVDSVLVFSNLNLTLYSYYLKNGFVNSDTQKNKVEEAFLGQFNLIEIKDKNFYSKLFWLQSKSWHFYIRQEFDAYFDNAKVLVSLFDEYPKMKAIRNSTYMKSIHDSISGAFMVYDLDAFFHYKKQLTETTPRKPNWNEVGHFQLYFQMHELDAHFLRGDFDAYIPKKAALIELLENNPYRWDLHRLITFHYKIACIHFGIEDYDKAIDHFNFVIHNSSKNTRLVTFSRLLLSFCHLKLGNKQLVYSLQPALQKELSKHKENLLEKQIFELLEELINSDENHYIAILEKHLKQVEALEKISYLRISFLHFYAKEWIQSMIKGVKPQEMIALKALNEGNT